MEINSIKCSVGILTYNSEQFLERCLQRVEGFAEIIISDGGSSDNTLGIAKKYGCKIIKQSNQGKPIVDFALERNRTLNTSSYNWFFYLDSDEIISRELKDEIRQICSKDQTDFYVYKVPYRIVSEDLSVIYKSFKTYYQNRFFNKKCGAKFVRKIHEKISYDENKYKAGVLKGNWYVPLDIQLNFKVYKEKVDHRLKVMAEERYPFEFGEFLKYVVIGPFKNIAKLIMKFVYLRLRYKKRELPPVRYEFYKFYSQWVIVKEFTKQYFKFLKLNLF